MRQTIRQLLLLPIGFCMISTLFEPTNVLIPSALAATGDSPLTTTSPTPNSRLMSRMPALKRLATPPNPIPAIALSSLGLSLSSQQGNSPPPPQVLTVSNRGGGTLNWNATTNTSWLILSPASGTGNGTVTISLASGSLEVGTHTGLVTVNAPGAQPVSVPITLTVTAAPVPPAIGVSSPSLSFTAQQGGSNPTAQPLSIRNTGGGTLSWTARDNVAWLTLSPAAGTGNGTVTITPVLGSLGVGTHTGSITLTAPGAQPVSVPITFVVTPAPVPPAIGVNSTSLSFTAQQGGSNPAAQPLSIRNTGGGTLSWTASDNVAWLTLSPAAGTGNGTVTIAPVLGSLGVGTHTGTITLSAPGAQPVSVPITFVVTSTPISITLSPSSLTYTGVSGGSNPANQSVTVTANGNWTASVNAAWLKLNKTSGTGNGTIVANVDLAEISAKTNTAAISVTAGSTTRTVGVTLILSTGSLTLSSNSLSFTATQDSADPAPKNLTINSNGAWTVTTQGAASWLSLSESSGLNNGTITAKVDTTKAKPGENQATITVASGGITRTATITLTLSARSNSSATLSWNANRETDLAGYRVYMATASGSYKDPIATLRGNVTTYQATSLQFGKTYFFVVTAFDIAGNESGYSNEVSKSIY